MPPTRDELYAEGRQALESARDDALQAIGEGITTSPPYLDDMRLAMGGREKAPRFALLTQLLLKILFPASEARRVTAFPVAPKGFSARSFAKQVVAPFDKEHKAVLGGSDDPYVINPLRDREQLTDELAGGDPTSQWGGLLGVLDYVEQHPGEAYDALVKAMILADERRLTLRKLLERGLALQADRAAGEDVQVERKELIEKRGPAYVHELLPGAFQVEGSSQTGLEAEVPWIRIFSAQHSLSAQAGWYAVYLLAADGSAAFLTLIQGVTTASSTSIEDGKAWVASILGPQPDFNDDIALHSSQGGGSRPALYEKASVYTRLYDATSLPSESDLEGDLSKMAEFLTTIYAAQEQQPHLLEDMSALSLELVLEQAAAEDLQLDEAIIASAVAALRSGKHLLLTGPPGTGKTTFAQVLAAAAASVGLCEGSSLTTATSDWTSADTVGGYWPSTTHPGQLTFRAGLVLASIQKGSWLIIDELNRSDIDKAIGALFTPLSGQPVTLPFEAPSSDAMLPVSIVPHGADPPIETIPYAIPPQWRLIATLNTRDRDLLFSLSYALLRRFAVIDIPVPAKAAYLKILADKGGVEEPELAARIDALVQIPHRPLGPAILLDVCSYVRERTLLLGAPTPDDAIAEAITAFILPQLDDLTRPQQLDVVSFARQHVLKGWDGLGVAKVFADTFHMRPQDLVTSEDVVAGSEGDGGDGDSPD